MANIRAHEKALLAYALKQLAAVPGLKIHGPLDVELRSGVISFELGDIHAHDVAQILDSEGVAIRAGHHCAQPLMEWLDAASTARLSVYLYTTESDIDALVAALGKVRERFA
jgi:cysteine desulfurase / selenocysteine lyase